MTPLPSRSLASRLLLVLFAVSSVPGCSSDEPSGEDGTGSSGSRQTPGTAGGGDGGDSVGESGGSTATPDPSSPFQPVISASRTECASPCTVVFSADQTSWQGMDEHDIWGRKLAYHWDFDTDETDTYGELYEQTYSFVPGDTAYEVGYAPMVTKTFLCDSGTCSYQIGLRAQDEEGNFADAYETITVQSEAAAWTSSDTICVSNTLDHGADWSSFDKGCPTGATKQGMFPETDGYDGKLILVKKGDVFEQNLAPWTGQSNFKIGYFGNDDEAKPEIDGSIWLGVHGISGDASAPDAIWTFARNETVAESGWSENITIEGIKTGAVSFPMSSQQVGIHNLDMDRESYASRGSIDLSRGRQYCTDSDELDCENVPFSKGVYISNVDVVGSDNAETNVLALNVSGIGCDMSNYTGFVDSRFRRAGEHNLRIMGWWRLSLMRNQWLGHHYSSGKQKITTRPCFDGDITPEDLPTAESPDPNIPDTWDDDPEGRTRADLFWGVGDEYLHVSRYQATIGNVVGDPGPLLGTAAGSTKIQTNVTTGYESTVRDVIYASNTFHNEQGEDTIDMGVPGLYVTCRDNVFSDERAPCTPSNAAPEFHMLRNPDPFELPLSPGSP